MEIVPLLAKGQNYSGIDKNKSPETVNLFCNPNTIIPQNKNPQKNAPPYFPTKDKALNYIDKNNADTSLKLFGEDISAEDSKKRFIVSSYDTIYTLSKNKSSHIYEYYQKDQPLKLILDIDYKIIRNQNNKQDLNTFDDMLVSCINTVCDKLESFTQINPIIIALKSCREDKLSAHLIFKNIHFKNISMMKCFMMTIDSSLINDKIIDPNIYKVGCMRLLWNSKYGKSNSLEYDDDCHFLGINKYTFVDNYQLFMDSLLTNISHDSHLIDIKIDVEKKTNKKSRKIVKKDIELSQNENVKYDISSIKQYLDIIDIKRADEYNDWVKIGMAIHNSNSSEEGFNLWNQWSSLSKKYNGVNINKWKWNSFNDNGLTINTLKYYAKIDNEKLYETLRHDQTDKENFNAYVINSNYLMENNEKIKDKKSIITQKICSWYDDPNIKSLVIKSPYNTGKTTMINSIFNEFNPKRILFITHRQSLTNELYGTFKKYRFCNYLNGSYDVNRFICQIESLHKIHGDADRYHYNNNGHMIHYDLIIMDEIESILNHFMSPTIQFKQQTFELMCRIIRESGKILALDGDFHNRGLSTAYQKLYIF